MKTRNSIRAEINALYRAKIITWLTEHVKNNHEIKGFPCRIYLGAPTNDEEVAAKKEAFLNFCQDWHNDLAAGKVEFLEKNYPDIGTVEVPVHLIFEKPDDIITWAGHLVEYHSAMKRLEIIAAKLPDLIDSALDNISMLTTMDDADFLCFVDVCKWIIEHKNSGCLIRQIRVRGVDTAWFESHRSILLIFLRKYLNLNPLRKDLLQLGLQPPPSLVRLLVLDHVLRTHTGGLRYFSTSVKDLKELDIKPSRVIFLEDLSTALSFPDMGGVVLILIPSHSLNELCHIDWIANAKCQFMAGISLRSFAMLNNVRVYLPQTESVLMDQHTFIANKDLWTYDDISVRDPDVPMALNPDESDLFRLLATGAFGMGARISQERIPLDQIFGVLGINDDLTQGLDGDGRDS